MLPGCSVPRAPLSISSAVTWPSSTSCNARSVFMQSLPQKASISTSISRGAFCTIPGGFQAQQDGNAALASPQSPPCSPTPTRQVLGGSERIRIGAGQGKDEPFAFALAAPITEVDKPAPGCSANVGHSLLSGQCWILAGAIICRLTAGNMPTVRFCSHPFGGQGEKSAG